VNLATQGSVDNLAQLAAAKPTCRAHYALVQDGLDWPSGLELVARLPRSESVFFLGRDADRIRTLTDLRGLRIGAGPQAGTALLAQKILQSRDLSPLNLKLTHLPLDVQIMQLQDGRLDLGVFVMDEDAHLIDHAVRDGGLAIMNLPMGGTVQFHPVPRLTREDVAEVVALIAAC
jgi:DNA-binding transcriptional LysR family regulator